MNHCGEEMEFVFKNTRGRWEKDTYKCVVCGERVKKRIKQIANVKWGY